MPKRWTKAETTYLTKHYQKDVAELAQRFKVEPIVVISKLGELGLSEPSEAFQDVALKTYTAGLEQLHSKKWQQAADTLRQVIADADSKSLRDRARQHLEICERQLDDQEETQDPYLQAVIEKNRGNLDAALHLCEQHGKAKDERFAYLQASIQAMAGAEEAALESLGRAIELEPKNRIHAFHDPDLEDLRENEDFQSLVARPGAAA